MMRRGSLVHEFQTQAWGGTVLIKALAGYA